MDWQVVLFGTIVSVIWQLVGRYRKARRARIEAAAREMESGST